MKGITPLDRFISLNPVLVRSYYFQYLRNDRLKYKKRKDVQVSPQYRVPVYYDGTDNIFVRPRASEVVHRNFLCYDWDSDASECPALAAKQLEK